MFSRRLIINFKKHARYYNKKVLDHYNDPKNVGSLDKLKKSVGTGLVGAPACGDVMKIQIEVEDGKIIDAKFKTFGCLAGNVIIATPRGYIKIRSLSIGDTIYAWNGQDIVENEIEEINTKWVHYKELLRFEFEGSCHFKFICSKYHIWWLSSDKPIEAENLNVGDKLIHISENKLRSRIKKLSADKIDKSNNAIIEVQNFIHNGLKVLNKKSITQKSQVKGLEMDGNNVKLYDIKLKEGANVYFAGRIGTHNCGSAIASSSYGTEYIKGKHLDEVSNISNKDIANYLKLPPIKLHCSMLIEDGIKAAIKDYKNKQN